MNKGFLMGGILLGLLSGALAQGPDKYLITAHHPNGIYLLDSGGKVTWKHTAIRHPQDVDIDKAGNIFCSEIPGAQLIAPDHSVLWKYSTPEGTQNPVAQILADGRFLVGNEGPGNLLEIDESGKTLKEIPLVPTSTVSHGQFRFCQRTPQGTYLVPLTKDQTVKEYAADGSVACDFGQFKVPVSAIRLKDGHTLIGSFNQLSEHDQTGREIWTFNPAPEAGLNGKGCHITGIVKLNNENIALALYHSNPAWPDLLIVNRNKEILHRITLPKIDKVAGLKVP